MDGETELLRHTLATHTATEVAELWGGLVARLPTFADGRPAPVANRRAGYHPAPPP
jgi:hypothetical protein